MAVGGRGTLIGAVLGAILVSLANTYVNDEFKQAWPFLLGGLFILGTEGYIELRKYTNVATAKGGNHLYIVDKKQARYIDCNKVPLPFGPQFVRDVVERTEVAQNQEQALLATELVLKAQQVATRPIGA